MTNRWLWAWQNKFSVRLDFEVTTACSGFECIELCRERPKYFDLVVLDLTMPDMNGEETFARLRATYPDLSIVISTGFIAQEKLNQMLASGLTGFIRKPLPPDEYVGHIRSILEKARFWQKTGIPARKKNELIPARKSGAGFQLAFVLNTGKLETCPTQIGGRIPVCVEILKLCIISSRRRPRRRSTRHRSSSFEN